MKEDKKLFYSLKPNSVREAFSLRSSVVKMILLCFFLSMVTGALSQRIEGENMLVSGLLLMSSWIFFILFLILTFRFIGLVFRFRGYLDNYIAKKINSQPLDKNIDFSMGSGIFEQLALNEKVICEKVIAGNVNGLPVSYVRYKVGYYPDRKNSITYKYYETYIFDLKNSKKSGHFYVDSKNTAQYQPAMHILKSCIEGNDLTKLEGDFSDYFNVYSNTDRKFQPLTTLTPDVMQTLKELCKAFDIEFCGDKVRLISGKSEINADVFLNNIDNVLATIADIPISIGLYNTRVEHLKVKRPAVVLF